MSSRAEPGLIAAALTLLSVALTWPLVLHLGDELPGGLGDPLLNAFTLAWDADRMTHGFRGLWDAPFFFPLHDTLAFSDHLLGVAVFTAPVQWLTGNAVLAYNLAFIASFVLAGFGAYFLARSLWGSRPAAWVAAVAFAAAPHRAMHVSHLQTLMSGWLAISLWGLHRWVASQSRRALAVAAGAYVLLALSSGYLMYFGASLIALVLAWSLAWLALAGRRRRSAPATIDTPHSRSLLRGSRRAVDLLVAGTGVLLFLAPAAAAYLRVRRATGLRRATEEIGMFSARISDFGTVDPAVRAWSNVLPAGTPERVLFPGLVVVVLAGVALLSAVIASARRRDGDGRGWLVGLYGAGLAASLWLTLGPTVPGPYRWLLAAVPGFDGLRVPARFIVVASLPLAVLAARGAQALAGGRRAGAALAVALGFVIGIEGFSAPLPLVRFDPHQAVRRELNAWLRAAPPGGLIELPATGAGGPPSESFTMVYQFNTLLHGHPIVNGYSGTGYGLQDFLAGPESPLARLSEVPFALRGLRAIGVRYLAVHRSSYERWSSSSPEPLVEAIDQASGQIASRVRFRDAVAWRFADLAGAGGTPEEDLRRLSTRAFTVAASDGARDARLAVDGQVETLWTTGRPQRGSEWFEVRFDRPVDAGRLVIRYGRFGHVDRPLRLVIESLPAEDGAARVLFDDSIVPQIIAGLAGLTDAAVIHLPANASRALRLQQTGEGGAYWSIPELEIEERRPAARQAF